MVVQPLRLVPTPVPVPGRQTAVAEAAAQEAAAAEAAAAEAAAAEAAEAAAAEAAAAEAAAAEAAAAEAAAAEAAAQEAAAAEAAAQEAAAQEAAAAAAAAEAAAAEAAAQQQQQQQQEQQQEQQQPPVNDVVDAPPSTEDMVAKRAAERERRLAAIRAEMAARQERMRQAQADRDAAAAAGDVLPNDGEEEEFLTQDPPGVQAPKFGDDEQVDCSADGSCDPVPPAADDAVDAAPDHDGAFEEEPPLQPPQHALQPSPALAASHGGQAQDDAHGTNDVVEQPHTPEHQPPPAVEEAPVPPPAPLAPPADDNAPTFTDAVRHQIREFVALVATTVFNARATCAHHVSGALHSVTSAASGVSTSMRSLLAGGSPDGPVSSALLACESAAGAVFGAIGAGWRLTLGNPVLAAQFLQLHPALAMVALVMLYFVLRFIARWLLTPYPSVSLGKNSAVLLIGSATDVVSLAKSLAGTGARVVVVHNPQDAQHLPQGVIPVPCNTTVQTSVEQAALTVRNTLEDESLSLHGIVVYPSSSGPGFVLPVEGLATDFSKRQMNADVFGPLEVVRALLSTLVKHRGRVVVVQREMPLVPTPLTASGRGVNAAKAAVVRTLRQELLPRKVPVILIRQVGSWHRHRVSSTEKQRVKQSLQLLQESTRREYGGMVLGWLAAAIDLGPGPKPEPGRTVPPLSSTGKKVLSSLTVRWPRHTYEVTPYTTSVAVLWLWLSSLLPSVVQEAIVNQATVGAMSSAFRKKDRGCCGACCSFLWTLTLYGTVASIATWALLFA